MKLKIFSFLVLAACGADAALVTGGRDTPLVDAQGNNMGGPAAFRSTLLGQPGWSHAQVIAFKDMSPAARLEFLRATPGLSGVDYGLLGPTADMVEATRTLQSGVRGMIARREAGRLREGRRQEQVRLRQEQVRLRQERQAMARGAAGFKGNKDRQQFLKKKQAAITIQAAFRGLKARRELVFGSREEFLGFLDKKARILIAKIAQADLLARVEDQMAGEEQHIAEGLTAPQQRISEGVLQDLQGRRETYLERIEGLNEELEVLEDLQRQKSEEFKQRRKAAFSAKERPHPLYTMDAREKVAMEELGEVETLLPQVGQDLAAVQAASENPALSGVDFGERLAHLRGRLLLLQETQERLQRTLDDLPRERAYFQGQRADRKAAERQTQADRAESARLRGIHERNTAGGLRAATVD